MQELMTSESAAEAERSRKKKTEVLLLTRGQISKFLKELEHAGRSEKTIDSYRLNLLSFYEFLGTEKQITAQSLYAWRNALAEKGYTPNSINSRTSAVNSLYNYLGKRNWQVPIGKRPAQVMRPPEITRREYLLLLQEAKHQENIHLYLLIKILATTDLTPSDVVLLTREAVDSGVVTGKHGAKGPVVLPSALQKELLDYARLWGLRTGPLFLSSEGKSYDRTAITRMIVQLAESIGIESGKANPRNLRRMHLNTLAQFQEEAQLWVNEQYEKLLSEEESKIGWRSYP